MRYAKFWIQSCLFWVGAKCAGLLKVSFMLGSYSAFFSATNCVVPLSGAFLGMGGSALVILMAMLFRIVLYGGLFPLSYLVHIVPGLCAAYYWVSRSMMIRLFLPILCMILFMAHPIGNVAWPYSLYWLVPSVLYVIDTKQLFYKALGSTFVAHAVGSVIWLYTMPTTVTLWYTLIPIVFIERICFAIGMVLLYKLILWVKRKQWSLFKTGAIYPV